MSQTTAAIPATSTMLAVSFARLSWTRVPTMANQGVDRPFLRLVLLPIIIVGQNVQAAAADARSLATYNDASAVLEEARQIQGHLKVQDDAIQQILATMSAATASKPLEMPTGRGQSESESHRV
jgi:hypothetical protein